ncbi:MAG: hypothetical protein ACYS7Y_25290 [Planctomycetota bacterium]|jgi:hypothetical protein
MSTATIPCKPCVSHLSTGSGGPYWTSPALFWAGVKDTLRHCGLRLVTDPPLFHNESGCYLAHVETPDGQVQNFGIYVSYYRMPSSNWELVCYTT